MITDDQAAGRVFCNFVQGLRVHGLDPGRRPPPGRRGRPAARDVWNWWVAIHHNIGLGGSPMNMNMPSSAPSAKSTPSSMSSMSPSPSMSSSMAG